MKISELLLTFTELDSNRFYLDLERFKHLILSKLLRRSRLLAGAQTNRLTNRSQINCENIRTFTDIY